MSGIPSIPTLVFRAPAEPPPRRHRNLIMSSNSPPSDIEPPNPNVQEESKPIHSPLSTPSSSSPCNSPIDPFSTPKAPRQRYQLTFDSPSPAPIKPSSGSGDRYKQDPESSSSSSLSKPVSSPTVLKVSKLELSRVSPQALSSETVAKWTPIRAEEAPGDISSRYCNPERSPHQTSSVRFSVGPSKSPLENQNRKSPATILFLKKKFSNTPIISPRESSSSSSTSLQSPPHFEVNAKVLHQLLDKKSKFSEEDAAKEIASCLKKEVGTSFILNLLSHYFHAQKEDRIEQRWNLLITAMLLRPECIDLVYAFLQKEKIPLLDLATIATSGFLYKRTPPLQVAHIISICTQKDLQNEKPDATLFRSQALSSSLISVWGQHLLKDFLNHLEKNIKKFWKRQPPSSLCLNREKVHQMLLKHRKGYSLLNEKEQENLCSQTIITNEGRCREFFNLFLENFYHYPLPGSFQDLLALRRNNIFNYLSSHQLSSSGESEEPIQEFEDPQKTSAIQVGADFILRIINPRLIEVGRAPSEIDSLLNLTKILQALSNQIPFGLERKNHELQPLNDVFEQFIATHSDYINKNFPLRLSPLRNDFSSESIQGLAKNG